MGPIKIRCSKRFEKSKIQEKIINSYCMTLLLTVLLLLVVGTAPVFSAGECSPCFPCHGSLENIHGNFNHTAEPGSGPVLVFADRGHDDAAWAYGQPAPHFDVTVVCTACHSTDLPAVHGNDCATCHPTPYDTLGGWNKGCQQGGCHPAYHQESTVAHLPWEDSYDYENNDCNICHGSGWWPSEDDCLNCHSGYSAGDVSPPTTKTNALAEYVGPARIGFSITDNNKVGVGRTFYQLDGGPVIAAGKDLFIPDDVPGQHQLKFWSKDQSGNTELAPKTVIFNIVEDNTPPTTTSNAKASYTQGAGIALTANDASTLGVKATYYQLNAGPVQSGTWVSVPATSGTIDYTLTFWSEDWAGNVEAQHSANFTVTSGNGILRLVWGDSDAPGSNLCGNDPEAWADWTIRRGSWSGPIVASGGGGCPNWDGVDDIAVQVGYTYFVTIPWWDSHYGWADESAFGNISVTTPGQVIRLSY
jgi:hypothetical protein